MIAEWRKDFDDGWYLQIAGGISSNVTRIKPTGQFTFDLCGIPMPSSYRYPDAETAKAAAAKALREHLQTALEKL